MSILGINKYKNSFAPPIKLKSEEVLSSPSKKYLIFFSDDKTESVVTFKEEIVFLSNRISSFEKKQNKIAESGETNKIRVLDRINAVVGTFTDNFVKELLKKKNNFQVTIDSKVKALDFMPSHNKGILSDKKCSWGLGPMGINSIEYPKGGQNVKIAILDTGFDFNHLKKDFKCRNLISHTLVGTSAQDNHGHGTHCIGIACGNQDENGIKFGVAYNSDIFVCKVLDDNGYGDQVDVIEGINWAISQGCKIISLSLGRKDKKNKAYKVAYEEVIKRAFENGAIVVCAVGNNSNRKRHIQKAIDSPSDSPSAIAVGGINIDQKISNYSNRAKTGLRQTIDFVAPADDIYSLWSRTAPNPSFYKTESGTSMAAPFVAGLVALYIEKYPTRSPQQIIETIIHDKPFKQGDWKVKDVGEGLIKASNIQ